METEYLEYGCSEVTTNGVQDGSKRNETRVIIT